MCVVIDLNTLAPVFSEACDKHTEFGAVKRWIEDGKGFLVYGGSKYKAELRGAFRYLKLIRQMKDAGKAIPIRDAAVDQLEEQVRTKTKGADCDDQHVIALLGASKCGLLCSEDSRSFRFVKDRMLYPAGMPRVKSTPARRILLSLPRATGER